jgi:hypothetical protein
MEKMVKDLFRELININIILLAQKILLPTSKRCADSINNVCIMDERGKRRENGKHLVVRDVNSIRFYKL